MPLYLFPAIVTILLAMMASASDMRANKECMAPEECGDSLLSHSMKVSSQRVLAREELERNAMQHLTGGRHKPTAGLVLSLRQLATELTARQENCSEVFNDTFAPVQNETHIVIDAELGSVVENQRRINMSWQRVQDCNDGYAQSGNSNGVETARQTHSTCRADQKLLSETKNTLCSDFETYQQGLSYPSCVYPQGTAVTAQCMQALSNFVNTHNATFFQKQLACNTATNNLQEKRATCDANQGAFEMAFCMRAAVSDDASTYTACFTRESAAYNQDKQAVQALEATSKAEYASAVQTQCLLNVLAQGTQNVIEQATQLDQCSHVDTSMLDITYPDLPNELPTDSAPTVTSRPCEGAWMASEYEGQAWYSDAPTTTCVACPNP